MLTRGASGDHKALPALYRVMLGDKVAWADLYEFGPVGGLIT